MADKAIYQHHERTTTAALEADLQLREIGIDPVQKTLTAYSEVLGTKIHAWTKESPDVAFNGDVTFNGMTTLNNTLVGQGAYFAGGVEFASSIQVDLLTGSGDHLVTASPLGVLGKATSIAGNYSFDNNFQVGQGLNVVGYAAFVSLTGSGTRLVAHTAGVIESGDTHTINGIYTFANALNASITGNAATVTLNANLTGPITSVGNTTSINSQTGTGSTFVMSTAPSITPTLLVGPSGTVNPTGETADITISGGSSGNVVASLTTRGFRTTDNSFGHWYNYHGANLVGKMSWARDTADNSAQVTLFTASAGTLTSWFNIRASGATTLSGAVSMALTLAVSGTASFASNIKVATSIDIQRSSSSAYMASMFYTNRNNPSAMSNLSGGANNSKGDALAIGNPGGNALTLFTNDIERLYIDSTGFVEATKTLRATGAASPVAGSGVEIDYGAISNTGRIFAYDRTGSAYKAFRVGINFNIAANGDVDVNSGKFTVAASTGDIATAGNIAITGMVALGGSVNTSHALRLLNSNLTGIDQYGIVSQPAFNASATNTITAIYAAIQQSATLNTAKAHGVYVDVPTKVGSTTIGINYGIFVANQNFAGATNYALYTNAGIVSFGDIVTCNNTTNKAHILLNGSGGNYGVLQTDAADTWSLAYKSTPTNALGTSVLKWNASNLVTITGTGSVTTTLLVQNGYTVLGGLTTNGLFNPLGGFTANSAGGYDEGTFTLNFSNGWAASQPCACRYVRVGKMVTLYFGVFTASSNSSGFSSDANLPSTIFPATSQYHAGQAMDAGSYVAAFIRITTLGSVTVNRMDNAAFGSSGTKGFQNPVTISYLIS